MLVFNSVYKAFSGMLTLKLTADSSFIDISV